MTIYILGTPRETARSLDDESLNRMIKEIAQVLSNVHDYVLSPNYWTSADGALSPKNINSKWSCWARECVANYNYLVELGSRCCLEHINRTYKYGDEKIKTHKMQSIIEWVQDNVPNLPTQFFIRDELGGDRIQGGLLGNEHTSIPLVMPKKYINYETIEIIEDNIFVNAINSYRNYYKSKLKPDATWTRREKPAWIII